MQRIDENTYIDDTLVTCAEYQLFIDELGEQGEFHQPDHWTSPQFSRGQAREPVLGVRFSDAKAFGEWLTIHDAGEWKYRLPRRSEATSFSLRTSNQPNAGFWIIDFEHRPRSPLAQFSVAVPPPSRVERRDFLLPSPAPKNVRELKYDSILAFADDYFQTRHLPIPETLGPTLDRGMNHVCSLPLALEFRHTPTIGLDPMSYDGRKFKIHFDKAIEQVLDRTLPIELRNISKALAATFERAINNPFRANDHSDFDDGFFLFLDIYTLQERIAGRSPAFEGIRIVKERLK